MSSIDSATLNRFRDQVASGAADRFPDIVRALGQAEGDRVLAILSDLALGPDRDGGAAALAEILGRGVSALSFLFARIEDRPIEARERLYRRLCDSGKTAWGPVKALLDTDDEAVFYWCCEAIGRMRPEGMEERVAAKLHSPVKFKRVQSARLAGALRLDAVADDLIELLSDPNGSVRDEAYSALILMGRQVLDRVIAGLGKSGGVSRELCEDAFAGIADEDSAGPLLAALAGVDKTRLTALMESAASISSPGGPLAWLAVRIAESGPGSMSRHIGAAISNFGPELEAETFNLARAGDQKYRYWAARILPGCESPRALEVLASLCTGDPSPLVRRTAFPGLLSKSDAGKVDETVEAVVAHDEDPEMISMALRAAARRGLKLDRDRISKLSSHPVAMVRKSAAIYTEAVS